MSTEDEDKTNQRDPEQLCAMGEQKIIHVHDLKCLTDTICLDVQFNEEELDQNSFTMDTRELSLTSPTRTDGCDESHNLFEHKYLNSAQSAIKRLFPFKSS
ncbi:hypothetical protein I4U23_030250 [Adineta vaga]|nr:hypothetical protein I4U23_030250 [Adineta vaga]